MTRTFKGTLAAIASAVSYGLNPLGALPLYKEGYSTASVLFYRFFFAILFLGGLFLMLTLVRRRDPKHRMLKHHFWIRKREMYYLLLLGVLFSTSALALFESFHFMNAGIACALVFLYPVLTAILMAIFFKEHLHAPTISAIIIALAGIWFLSKSQGNITWKGALLVGWSALSYALYIIIVNKAKLRIASSKLTFYSLISCTLTIMVYAWITTGNDIVYPFSFRGWLYGWGLAIVPTVLSLLFMVIAVRNIGSTPTAVLGAIEPVTAVAIGTLLFHEPFTPRIAMGVALILAAVLIIINERHLSRVHLHFHRVGMKRQLARVWQNRWYMKHKYYDPHFKRKGKTVKRD